MVETVGNGKSSLDGQVLAVLKPFDELLQGLIIVFPGKVYLGDEDAIGDMCLGGVVGEIVSGKI